jgi:hypothetical protein
MDHRTRLLVSAGLFFVGVGCGSSTQPPPVTAPVVDAAPVPGDPDADTFIPCDDDPRAEHYAPSMQKTGPKGQITVTLLSSDPGPPIKGVNTWKVLVTESGKTPQAGVTMKVVPFMPDHGHGTNLKPAITPLADVGQYQVTPLYLFMAGLWEVTLNVTTTTGSQDAVVFRFCIQQ